MKSDIESSIKTIEDISVKWLEENSERFDPLPDQGYDLSDLSLRRKSFSELATLLYVVNDLKQENILPRLEKLFCARVLDPRYTELLRRNPNEILLYAPALAVASTQRLLDESTSEALAVALAEPVVQNTERTPFRALDLWHVRQLADQPDSTVTIEELIKTGCLGTPFDIVTATSSHIYALTHSIFYYYNFGIRHPDFPKSPVPTAFDLGTVLSGLLLRSIAEDDTDLSLELLLAGTLSDRLPSELIILTLDWILKQTNGEYIPGPSGSVSEKVTSGKDANSKEWAQHYHTNLVAVLTTTLLRHRSTTRIEENVDTAGNQDYSLSLLCNRGDDNRKDNLLDLGSLIVHLHEYRLEDAAPLLSSLLYSSVSLDYRGILETTAMYLYRQQTDTGTFGFWADERSLFIAAGGDPVTFENRFVRPVSEACKQTLSTIEEFNLIDNGA